MKAGIYLSLKGVVKRYGAVRAVDGVTLDIGREEFVTLLGASGSGKTTTLMMIAGFTMPDEGAIILDGEDITYVPAFRRNIGVVFQNYSLFPHMSVFENVAYPLRVRKVGRDETRRRAETALDLVQLSGFGGRFVHQLSGGQQQRVALARALVFEPRLLLMDEPLGALDKKLREAMQLEIKHLQRRLKITVVYVTHDQAEALTMSDRIAIMRHGRFEQIDSPQELYRRPANRFVADFIGESCFLEVVVTAAEGEYAVAQLPEGPRVRFATARELKEGDSVVLMVRPEAVGLATSSDGRENQAAAVVDEVIYLGEIIKYRLKIAGGQVLYMKRPGSFGTPEHHLDEALTVAWRVEDTRLL